MKRNAFVISGLLTLSAFVAGCGAADDSGDPGEIGSVDEGAVMRELVET
jgi:hypothetical protein